MTSELVISAFVGLFSSVIAAAIIAIGWWVSHKQTIERDVINKRRDQTVHYLIEAYRGLECCASRSASDVSKYADRFENAIADIQLFGTKVQAQMAFDLCRAIAQGSPEASTGPLLHSLRDDLRRELGLERIEKDPVHFRVRRKS